MEFPRLQYSAGGLRECSIVQGIYGSAGGVHYSAGLPSAVKCRGLPSAVNCKVFTGLQYCSRWFTGVQYSAGG
jgi:hypothetical protein